jgi:hypothetical protein
MSRYYEVRKRISTEKSPLSDAEIIESLDREIEEYRDKIVRMEDIKRKHDLTEFLMSEEMRALKNKNKGLSEELDKLKEEKKILIINSDTLMTGRTNGKHMHQMIDEILSIPANRTVIRIYADSDRVPTMSWEINGYPYNDD